MTASTQVDWKRAHLLALASQWAYQEDSVARQRAQDEGGYPVCGFFQHGETRGLVASNEEEIVVAFRGSSKPENWLRNFTFLPVARQYFELHSGFNTCLEDVFGQVWSQLTQQGFGSRKLWLTGHSLGGALATILAAELSGEKDGIAGIQTFGQPCAGLKDFAAYFDAFYGDRCFRFVHGQDLVTRLPPGFSHVRQRIQLGAATRAGEELLTDAEFHQIQAELARTGDQSPTRGQILSQIPGFADHGLQHYINRIAERLAPSATTHEPPSVPAGHSPASIPNAPATMRESTARPEPGAGGSTRKAVEILPPLTAAPPQPDGLTPLPLDPPDAGSNPGFGLPLRVDILWSPESRPGGSCPAVAEALFTFLSHPPGTMPDLEIGVGIPVHAGHHWDSAREEVQRVPARRQNVIILLLDHNASGDEVYLDACKWFRDHGTHKALVLLVYLDETQPIRHSDILVASTSAARLKDPAAKSRAVCWDVGAAICRRLAGQDPRPDRGQDPVQIFISYARADADEDDEFSPPQWLFRQISRTKLQGFFDQAHLVPGEGLSKLAQAQGRAITLVIHTDTYSESPYCQEELLTAKRLGMPIVTLQLLKDKERRSLPYGGNSLTIAWKPTPDQQAIRSLTDEILDRCLQVWLKHLHFHRAGPVAYRRSGFQLAPTYLSRPPELLDFAQGPLSALSSSVVLYPDPPLPIRESNLILHNFRNVRLATPTTLATETLRKVPTPLLRGMRIALSLSNSPDLADSFQDITPAYAGTATGGRGILSAHLSGTTAYLTLTLVRAGAELGYGGHLDKGNTPLLSNLATAHLRFSTGRDAMPDDFLLHCYVAEYLWQKRPVESRMIRANYHRIADPANPGTEQTAHGEAFQLSLMRRRMALDCPVRIIMGGKKLPKGIPARGGGYSGRFPGQAEEALHHLLAGKPVYVIGGFHGVAEWVSLALQDSRESLPQESVLRSSNRGFDDLCENYDRLDRSAIGIDFPATQDELWRAFAEAGKGYFWGDGSELDRQWNNGLTVKENHELFTSVQYDEIAFLIMKGLKNIAKPDSSCAFPHPFQFCLYNGPVTEVPNVDAYGTVLLSGQRLREGDKLLDEVTGGALGSPPDPGEPGAIHPVKKPDVDGQQVLTEIWTDKPSPVALPGSNESPLHGRLIESVKAMLQRAHHNGILSLGLPSFAMEMGLSPEESAHVMARAIVDVAPSLPGFNGIAWCEPDPELHGRILSALQQLGDELQTSPGTRPVKVTSLLPRTPRTRVPLTVSVRQEANRWIQFCRSSDGGTAIPEASLDVDWTGLENLFGSMAPPFEIQADLGKQLAERVFSESMRAMILSHQSRPWDLNHDDEASVVPFEMLAFQDAAGHLFRPALTNGIHHGLYTRSHRAFSNRSRRLRSTRMLLIANPTGDDSLLATGAEADAIQQAFQDDPFFEIIPLVGPGIATKAAVLAKLRDTTFDLIHYAGHGHYDKADSRKSGLSFEDGVLTAMDLDFLSAAPHGNLPALIFLNACESGKVDDALLSAKGTASLARRILEAGVDGFISTRWKVLDDNAARFAITTYSGLSAGQSVGEAIQLARNELFRAGRSDWSNFVHYGSPGHRL